MISTAVGSLRVARQPLDGGRKRRRWLLGGGVRHHCDGDTCCRELALDLRNEVPRLWVDLVLEDERVTVEDGRFVDANTSGLWVVNEGELATVSNASGALLSGAQTDSDAWTDSGVWVHDPDIDDVANYPVEPGDSITVGNITNRTRLVVFWHEQDGGRLAVFWTDSDPAPPCRG